MVDDFSASILLKIEFHHGYITATENPVATGNSVIHFQMPVADPSSAAGAEMEASSHLCQHSIQSYTEH